MKREIDEKGNIIIRDFPRTDMAKPWDTPGLYVRNPVTPVDFFRALIGRIEESGPILFAAVLLFGLLSFGVLAYFSLSESEQARFEGEFAALSELSEGAGELDGSDARFLQASTPNGASDNPAEWPRLPAAAMGVPGEWSGRTSGSLETSESQTLFARPDRQLSSLQVSSVPEGGTVLVDFDSVGTAPMNLQLSKGVYVLSVVFPEGVRRDSVIILENPSQRAFTFLEQEVETRGSNEVGSSTPAEVRPNPRQSNPPAARQTRAIASNSDARTEAALPSDSDDAREESTSGTDERERRAEPTGQDEEVRSDEAEQVAGTGTIAVRVKPWGSIFVDGTLQARNSDLRHSMDLEAGTHRVRVEHPALGVREVEVTVRPGVTLEVPVDLLSTSQ